MYDISMNNSEMAGEAKVVDSFKKNSNDYYIDQEFFDIDPIMAEEYNRRISELASYSVHAENYIDMTDFHNRVNVFAALSYAVRKAGEAEAWASYFYNTARSGRKEAEAIAALDDFGDYIEQTKYENRGLKATDKNREWFIQKSPRVIQAMKREAMAEAIQKSFWIYRLQFVQALSTIKSLAYGQDGTGLSSYDHQK